ncbi:MAG: NAD(P)H-dependent oxidoreductase subunit E [Lachnospiraceae bacterium]|jgi:NADH-quinone oxidoreductase subunit E/NADP-reducing hydrogenase subunit HndA|nr:NAD(P)H-dependent oxidoreductase subunit E [Lachnospiraceae bacterium]MBR2842665.1 NAD(P)H-dependent oxidoreductase subunit E [Lachnospiraceae bacterium]MBR3262977.1 NAD(P)H-dependent oxidoreductase subunit E [Lachnospiraceae bacterium]MBR3360902.1 NAD(P)H-dependent oxidoreductase subunit E [Lachnospiraceae bacterium]MBR6357029.1 NAD(P)H-dependent oxidoreductase subunit E [Lachnospiraceae bacterium]
MAKAKTTVAFQGTLEQEKALQEVIDAHKGQAGALMPVLQAAQGIYGYLPVEVQEKIAAALHLSVAEVYGVVTFYSQFSLNPKGKYSVSVCLGTACYVKGSDKILEAVESKLGIKSGECTSDAKFSVDVTRCLGACGLAPVMTVNEDVYGKAEPKKVAEIIDRYMND